MCSDNKHWILPFWLWILFFSVFTSSSVAQSGSAKTEESSMDNLVSWWSFDSEDGRFALDEIQRVKDSLYGSFEYVPGISGNAIKLDGFRTFIKRDQHNIGNIEGAFTVEAWIALASYPWSWSPVVDCSFERLKGFFFGIGPEGQVSFNTGAGNSWHEVTSDMKIPLREWTHIATVFEPGDKISVFINGEEVVSVDIKCNFVPQWDGSLTIGRNNGAQTWHELQFTTNRTYFFLDGILDEIKISGSAKTEDEIRSEYAAVKELPLPALSTRDEFPVGSAGSGSFGAFYTRLDYYKEWDDL